MQLSSSSPANPTGSFTVHGVPYSSRSSNQYVCLECGLQLNKALAYAHSYMHLQQRTRHLALESLPATPMGPRRRLMIAAKSPAPATTSAPASPVLKTHFVATLAVVPQKRKPSCVEALQRCRRVQQDLHRLVHHLGRLRLAVQRTGFRRLRHQK